MEIFATADSRGGGKLFAGGRLRRLRLRLGVTQTRMAEDLGVSTSYLNLIERNQRPLTAAVLLRLAEAYDIDVRELTGADSDRAAGDLVRLLERHAPQPVSRAEARDFADSHPLIAAALQALASRAEAASAPPEGPPAPLAAVRAHLLERQNHFPSLEAHAEALADELRLSGQSLDAALRERMRARHGLVVRLLPLDVMPDRLRRIDLHARQLLLSEALDGASRTFQLAAQLADLEARDLLEAELATARPGLAPAGPVAERLLRINLANYWAGALMMPYARFHAAAEQLGYDLELLQARFSAGFE
ncbi:MAG: ImmA/IrrE family metallo-endopeptidase, partial [Sphingomonadaceae bacterium]